MKRGAYFGLIGLLAGCGATAPATPSPSVAPTAAPTPTLAPTPVPTVTAIADPTYTPGDQRADEFIRDGFAQLTVITSDIGQAADLSDMVSAYRAMASLANSQQLIAGLDQALAVYQARL